MRVGIIGAGARGASVADAAALYREQDSDASERARRRAIRRGIASAVNLVFEMIMAPVIAPMVLQ